MRQIRKSQATMVVLVAVLLFVTMPGRASTATIVVNSSLDNAIAGDGQCSLREAIDNANGDIDTTGGDCEAGTGADTVTIFVVGNGTIALSSALPAITDTAGLTINGASTFIIGGCAAEQPFPVFRVTGGALTLNNVGVFFGCSTGDGGGIFIDGGTVTLANSTVFRNAATSNGGGIFASNCTLTLTNSTVSGNVANTGGGITASNCTVMLTNSTVSLNFAYASGGGIYHGPNNDANSALTLTNSTVSGNFTYGTGGGLYNDTAAATVVNSTLSGNTAQSGGGGIFYHFDAGFPDHTLTFSNSIVANNPSGGNCHYDGGPIGAVSNLTTDESCLGFTQVTPAQLNLGPLAYNGGWTNTHALLAGSVAIDAGDQAACTASQVTSDQREFVRDATCDFGAYEFAAGGLADLAIEITVIPNTPRDNKNVTYLITVVNGGPDQAKGVLITSSVPAGTTLVSATSLGPFGTRVCIPFPGPTGDDLWCDVGDLENGQSASVTVVVRVDTHGNPTITNNASVDSIADDPVPANNTASIQRRLHGGK